MVCKLYHNKAIKVNKEIKGLDDIGKNTLNAILMGNTILSCLC